MPRKKSKVQKTKEGLKIPPGAKRCLTFDENGNELWEIENVLEEREKNGKKEYLVKWRNWPYRYCTWEPEENFLEDMSIILNFVKEINEGRRPMYKHLIAQEKEEEKALKKAKAKKKAKKQKDSQSRSRSRNRSSMSPPASKSSRNNSRSRSITRSRYIRKTSRRQSRKNSEESCADTKIVIQKLTIPTTANVIQMEGNNNIIVTNADGYLIDPSDPECHSQKMTNVFICREGDIGLKKSIEKKAHAVKRNTGNSRSRKGTNQNRGRTRGLKGMNDDDDDDDDDDLLSKMGENESDNDSEVKSKRSDFSLPLMENELEKISDCRIVVEECFTFSNSNTGHPASLRFKVAFRDEGNNLKGYDYVSYEEIKQKKWEGALLNFYAQEILTEMQETGRSMTPNIKII